jgi:PAS domain-containing protein
MFVTPIDWQLVYVIGVFVTLVLLASMVGMGLRLRRRPGGWPFLAVSVCATCWAATVVMIALSPPASALFWLKAKYLFMTFLPVLVAWFALEYTGWMPRRRVLLLAALCLPPLVRLTVLWHEPWRPLLLAVAEFERTGSLTHLSRLEYGPWHWMPVTYGYSMMLGSIVLVLLWAARSGPLARPQGIALAAGAAAPLVMNILTLVRVVPIDMDLMPMGLAIAVGLIGWAVVRHRALDLVPVARDVVLDAIEDGVLATDADGRVVDLNRAMASLIGVAPRQALGRPAAEVLARTGDLVAMINRGQLDTPASVGDRRFAMRVVPLPARTGRVAGRLLLLQDVTARVAMEVERERLIGELRGALAQVRTLSGLLPICASCKFIRDEEGRWHPADAYIRDHSDASVSHAMCPACTFQLYPEAYRAMKRVGVQR